MVYWEYVSQSIEQNDLSLSESATTGTSEQDIAKIGKKYSNTVANGLSNGAMPYTKKTKQNKTKQKKAHTHTKKPPFRSGKNMWKRIPHLINAMALDPEERVLYLISHTVIPTPCAYHNVRKYISLFLWHLLRRNWILIVKDW